jgi:hypothetical protein
VFTDALEHAGEFLELGQVEVRDEVLRAGRADTTRLAPRARGESAFVRTHALPLCAICGSARR